MGERDCRKDSENNRMFGRDCPFRGPIMRTLDVIEYASYNGEHTRDRLHFREEGVAGM